MRCSKCGTDNRKGCKFCTNCATALIAACPQCGAPIQPRDKFSGECGAALTTTEELSIDQLSPAHSMQVTPEVAGAVSHPNGERKMVTALFADIKDSTELIRELDPEEARGIIDPVLELMMGAVHRYDGYVAQATGDGIFAMFGAPVAHEDHPQRALHAALAIQDRLGRYNEKTNPSGLPRIQARIGINTGICANLRKVVSKEKIHLQGSAAYGFAQVV